MNGIVCIEWLNVNLNLTDLVILDASCTSSYQSGIFSSKLSK